MELESLQQPFGVHCVKLNRPIDKFVDLLKWIKNQMSGNILTIELQTNNASCDQQDYAIIVTAFHYNFPWSAQLARVLTICCLDTPLCAHDQMLGEYSSGPDHYTTYTDIKKVMTCRSVERQTTSALTALIATLAIDY